jgi:hypothetical protein
MVVELHGRINEFGELEVDLPDDLPVGEVRIVIESLEDVWAEGELEELMRVDPMTGADIVAAGLTGGWKDLDINDGAEWIQEQRRKRKARHES